ncbi:flavodoxin family protein [Desulfitobacterium sp. Sab5]|uniref:flavodoxin family protein n=1 Tax=Desulfitobacterium nosdiversum TaxID=3375356 RepID=UPI003CF7E1E0
MKFRLNPRSLFNDTISPPALSVHHRATCRMMMRMGKGVIKMKVIGINGSPRPNGNTSIIIKEIFKELERSNIETELVQLGGNAICGCTACGMCFKSKNGRAQCKAM